MKKKFKKNHVIITVFAILIAITGYINYISNINDNKNSADNAKDNGMEILSNDVGDEIVDPGETILTSGTGVENMVAQIKLEREQSRAKNKETLFEIIDNIDLAEENKKDAINKVIELSDISEKEIATEILLEAKGFANAIVSLNADGVDVVIDAETITDAQRAQILDIVTRKTEFSMEKVVITPITKSK
ncbi:MAG: SpoIIIAH-like family protein [Lachnospiraceae bacterium]|nr:SpoIIIAH-like family protein [Lachnospira sp.]MBR6696964.1 SpoIIIAH-like family protein [Lachnospiraceae bacterium]